MEPIVAWHFADPGGDDRPAGPRRRRPPRVPAPRRDAVRDRGEAADGGDRAGLAGDRRRPRDRPGPRLRGPAGAAADAVHDPGLLDDRDDLRAALATVLGLDVAAIVACIDQPQVIAAYDRRIVPAPARPPEPRPLDGLEHPEGGSLEVGGFQPFESYDTALANLDPSLERRQPPSEAVAAVHGLPIGLTTAEVAAIMRPSDLEDADRGATERELIAAVDASLVSAEPRGCDAVWLPAASTAAPLAEAAGAPRPAARVPRVRARLPVLAAIACVLALALAPGAAAEARFDGSAHRIGPQLRQRMSGVSWHPGCPVGFHRLRLLKLSVWGFDGRVHRGRLVVNEDAARPLLGVMRRLFVLRFPIRRMRLVDAYGGDDHRSMEADNTSAFNCRFVAGSERWSEHAYGRAIDVNPIENPYADGEGYVSPPQGAPFADRSRRAKGLIHRRGPVVAAFAAVGWGWGGNWSWPKDYQHFSASGN